MNRRDFLSLSVGAAAGVSASGWFGNLAALAAESKSKPKSCILLWMNGGPSQIDTFDPKPNHENGGEFKAIQTSVDGLQFSSTLPKLSKVASELAVVRSMQTVEGDHTRASFHLRTGQRPTGPIRYPVLGSLLSKQLNTPQNDLPGFVSIFPYRQLSPAAWSSGFLGPQHAPLFVGSGNSVSGREYSDRLLHVRNLKTPGQVTREQATSRRELLSEMESEFHAQHLDPLSESHRSAYERAVRMMESPAIKGFEPSSEPEKLRQAYGKNYFGQGCLLARRLVERGVPFVEVSLNSAQGTSGAGWDTHNNNFRQVGSLCEILDPAYSTLITDLRERGMLDDTLVIWMGEFGRTPRINASGGRDHYPAAWSAVLAGAGVAGGRAIGSTGEDGTRVIDRPVSVPELYASICKALGIDPHLQNMSNVGRPIRIAELEHEPVEELF